MTPRPFLKIYLPLTLCLLTTRIATASSAAPTIDFNREVRPILSENCAKCHGFDEGKRKGKLRLDDRDAALRGGKSGDPAIVPGKPEQSAMIARITSTDADEQMPPPETKSKLTPAQVETLKKWIADGAEYQVHWAFKPPQRPAPPVLNDAWARNVIDRFVLARLQSEGLHPSPQADPATLLRRLSLDLIGLPPTPAELDTFLADTSPNAYEKQVDRLLSSEHFGEKWARHWLDVARYADSDGYEKDLPRKQHAWRDWVINALNRDLPYDQFVIEQIAGDLLPSATQQQKIATGFLRNGMVNEEGAIIAEQFRMEGLIDRMDCIGKSVLGLTIQCAQCHNHKYDPLTQEEYYRLMAFMNNDYEATTWIYSPEQLEQIKKIQTATAELEAQAKTAHPNWKTELAEWEVKSAADPATAQTIWQPLDATEQVWVGGLSHPEKMPDKSILTLGFRPTDGDLYVITSTKHMNLKGLRLEALTHGDLPFGGPGRSYKGAFAVSELIVEAMPIGGKEYKKVALTHATADFESPEAPIDEFFRKGADDKRKVGPASFLIDGKEDTAWSPDRGPGRRHADSQVVMEFAQPVGFPEGTQFKITLRFKHGGPDGHGRQNNFLGRFRLSVTDAPHPQADPRPRPVREALATSPDKRTPEQEAALFSYWRTTSGDLKPLNEQIEKLWAAYPQGETILNLAQRAPIDSRESFLLERGNWQKPGRKVTPGVPSFLNSISPSAQPTRLTLARWLVDRKSPTAARVAVNRTWQSIFGVGLVETAEDFGIRASDPSHPELLDWLAVEFMEPTTADAQTSAWSTKHLLRTIVTSATYRQSSRITPEMLEKDPRNRLLARGPRFRVEAEVVRDVALSAAGLLNEKIGGPSFFPPVPESLFGLSYLQVDFWKTASAPERYRRSLYVFRRRSMPDPFLACFDAPNGDAACARRVRSNTPLAALSAMNETVFVEAAQSLAIRILKEGGTTDEDRAAYAFRLCTARKAKPQEIAELLNLLNSRRQRLADGWLSAREISTGDITRLPQLPQGATPTDAAAWTVVSRVLLNLDELVVKN